MSELIDGQAIAVPEQSKLENYATLDTAEQAVITEQVIEMQAVTADAVLKGADGFDILNEMCKCCGALILTTATLVLPIKQQLEDICANLTDPEGFKRSYQTLCSDITNFNTNLKVLASAHAGRTGKPAEEEITDVFALADGYNKLTMHFESGIQPLMQVLSGILDKEYNPVLERELNANA